MIVKIETYRNFDISLNTDTGEFISISDYYDTQSKKSSFNAAKKAIDDCVKANQSFKPFFAVQCDYSGDELLPKMVKVKIVSTRKDGNFITDGGAQISKYDNTRWLVWCPEIDEAYEKMQPITDKIEAVKKELDALYSKRRQIAKSGSFKNLKEFKAEI